MAVNLNSTPGDSGIMLIRFGLASYFLASAIGLIEGVNPAAAFALVMPERMAAMTGTASLVAASLLMMVGHRLRFAGLVIAGLMLSASLTQHIMDSTARDISAFWRDLALIFAVMLTYWANLVSGAGPGHATFGKIKPRRIASDKRKATQRTARADLPTPRRLMAEVAAETSHPPPVLIPPEPAQAVAAPKTTGSKQGSVPFTPLPLTSPSDEPRENIFVQI